MSRRRKSAAKAHLDATERMANMKSIDAALNLGTGLTIAALQSAVTACDTKLDTYNQTIALSDVQLNEYDASVKDAAEISTRMLAAVGSKYGFDSDEYEQAGGTRKSERKKPVRKPKNNP